MEGVKIKVEWKAGILPYGTAPADFHAIQVYIQQVVYWVDWQDRIKQERQEAIHNTVEDKRLTRKGSYIKTPMD